MRPITRQRAKNQSARFLLTPLHRFLVAVIIVMVLVIFVGTVWAVAIKKTPVGLGLRKSDPSPESIVRSGEKPIKVYSGLSRLRSTTADNPPISVIISPYFPYAASDASFYEEISQKTRQMRSIILDYFTTRTRVELLRAGEQAVKDDLLKLLNAELVLGKISVLYFSEYILLD